MRAHIVLAGCLAATLLWASPALADDEDEDDSPDEKVEAAAEKNDGVVVEKRAETEDAVDESKGGHPAKIGLVHDTLRRAKKQPTLFQKVSDEYADLKTRMEDDHGLTWSFSLSYRQRWVSPDNIGTSSQALFWPSLNWDIFDSESFGSGSFQFLYYGERRSGSKVTVNRGSRTLSGELPDYQNKYSQITYTHTLPGEMFAVAVGQYSFFNFDSSEFMADQQLNFVNNIFSANGSSTYPTTGTGGYVQFNATKTLQFLAGGQSVNVEDPSKRPTDGFLSSPYAWLGYVQWRPAFKGLGDAQYSLTLYQSPAVTDHPASQGWSINAVQHLNDQWAIFGRLNASNDDNGGNKRSFGIGVALNNPLGRADGDQIGVAFGSLEQKLPLPFVTLEHTQNTLEAYWNWSLVGGLLLTPDVQYIRNPAFAPDRDSAWIMSLRATLVF
jgi:porin